MSVKSEGKLYIIIKSKLNSLIIIYCLIISGLAVDYLFYLAMEDTICNDDFQLIKN